MRDKKRGFSYGSGNNIGDGPLFTQDWMLKDAKQIIQSSFWDMIE
jgi:hypothetical protein